MHMEHEHRKPGLKITQFRQMKKSQKTDFSLDLHGLTRQESIETLQEMIANNPRPFICQIIHGKGTYALADEVRKWALKEHRCMGYWLSMPHDLGSTNICVSKGRPDGK